MILALRQRHRRMFAVIGLLLPICFALGLAARKPVPQLDSLPPALAETSESFTTLSWNRTDLFMRASVQARLFSSSVHAGKYAITLKGTANFIKPDLIVYWVAGNPTIKDAVPSNAMLLGAFSAAALPLPPAAAKGSSVLILYSLADQEIVDLSRPFNL